MLWPFHLVVKYGWIHMFLCRNQYIVHSNRLAYYIHLLNVF